MTADERRTIRHAISEARRSQIQRTIHAITNDTPDGKRPCAYCGTLFEIPAGSNAARKRFCRLTHKANWFRRERMRREREQRKEQAA